jgi:hypothetical protein
MHDEMVSDMLDMSVP